MSYETKSKLSVYVSAILVPEGGQVPLHVKNFSMKGIFDILSTSILLPMTVYIFWIMFYTITTISINFKGTHIKIFFLKNPYQVYDTCELWSS